MIDEKYHIVTDIKKTDMYTNRNSWGLEAEEFIFVNRSILLFVEGPQKQNEIVNVHDSEYYDLCFTG